MKNKEIDKQIEKEQRHLICIEDYVTLMSGILNLVGLATKFSIKADLDEGQSKKTWRMILADVLTMKKDAEDEYSETADEIQRLKSKRND